MISTVTLVKRGTSSSSSTAGSSIRKTLYSTTTSQAQAHHTGTPAMKSGITRHWIQSFHRMTLHPHLFQASKQHTTSGRLAHVPRNCATRSYHRSSRAQSNAALVPEYGSTELNYVQHRVS